MDEYQILERVKDWYRTGSTKAARNFLLNDTTIISVESYERSYHHTPSINKQVTGYVNNDTTISVSDLEFPMFQWEFILYAYLHKKGYVIIGNSPLGSAPLPNLKYIIYSIMNIKAFMGVAEYEFKDRLVIELVDLDVVGNNLNLPNIVSSVLGSKLLRDNNIIEDDEFYEIVDQISSQKVFAGNTWDEAYHILFLYFDKNKRKLSKEVFKISVDYVRVFRPYRVVYDTKTWEPVMV